MTEVIRKMTPPVVSPLPMKRIASHDHPSAAKTKPSVVKIFTLDHPLYQKKPSFGKPLLRLLC